MPTSAIGSRKSKRLTHPPMNPGYRRGQSGFSLVELLVALFVVVLIVSMVNLSVSSGGRDIELESQITSIAAVGSYAMDEAQMAGLDYGLLIEQVFEDGDSVFRFGWRERRQEGWRPPEQALDVFATQTLPPEVELELELEDVPVPEFATASESVDVTPQVIFYSSGETSAGALNLRDKMSGELLWRIEWDLLGRFSVLPRGEALPEEDDG